MDCLQQELVQIRHAASSQTDAGQEEFNSESKEAQTFAQKLVDDCMAYAKVQLQAMRIVAEAKQAKLEQKICDVQQANEEIVETLQAQVHF